MNIRLLSSLVRRPAVANPDADALRLQAALLNPRTQPRPPHPAFVRLRAYVHELRTDPKAPRLLRARIYRATLHPLVSRFL